MRNVHLRLPLLIIFFIFCISLPMFAEAELSPGKDRADEKKYFTYYAVIYYSSVEDLHRFTGNIGTGLSYLIHSPKKNPRLTAERVDALVMRVMKILEIQIPSLRFAIRVFHEQDDLDLAFVARTRTVPAPAAFYDPETATIAIAANSVTENILAHEITHAIICAWFSPPPPARLQEILAQYVDRHLGEE